MAAYPLTIPHNPIIFPSCRQEPEAIKIFRKMVTDCLSGVQVRKNGQADRQGQAARQRKLMKDRT